jgi:hypothetical protein
VVGVVTGAFVVGKGTALHILTDEQGVRFPMVRLGRFRREPGGLGPARLQTWRVSTTTDSMTTSFSGRSVRGLVWTAAMASTTF